MQYDVIVVGSGSAGGILATRLSEDPNRSVLLLQARPDYPNLEDLPDDLKYSTTEVAFEKGAVHDWGYVGTATPEHTEPMVVDASIMPDVIRANTNATAFMIGERIADLMRDRVQ